MPLSLSQLIVACGDDKVEFQNLDQCAVSLDYSAKHGNRITFGTTMDIMAASGTEKVGLVVWLDRDLVADVVAKNEAAA
jgi:transcription elongation GreA/GreB family factor